MYVMQDTADQATRTHIVFIDPGIANYQALLASLDPSAEVHLIDSRDGLAQIAATLAGRSGIDAVHVLSHGTAGTLQLGALALTAQVLEERSADVAAIRAALSADADLLLYGCDAGAGSAGAALVDTLARLTGADVAASTGLTGAAAAGGDWVLERSSGTIETAALGSDGAFDTFAGTLATPVTFGFESNFNADQNIGAPGTATATQTVGAHTLTVTAPSSALVVVPEGTFTGNSSDAVMNGNVLAVDWSDSSIQLPLKVRMQLDSGKVFTLTSFSLINTSGLSTLRVTTDKGFVDFTLPFDPDGHVYTSSAAALQNASYAEFTDADGNPIALEFDDIVLSNISVPPTFVGSTTTLTAAQNAGAVDMSALLHVSDTDSGETLTWTQKTMPTHGTLTLSGATAATGSSNITPGGTLTYTPTAGYAGTDTFTVQVSDGSVTATRTITVNVNPAQPGAPDLAAASDTGASSTDNITAANVMTFSGTSAAGDVASTVRVFIDTNNNGAYNAGEATGTATVNNGSWTVSGINTAALTSGNYNVYSLVTSATGSLTSSTSAPLAITVDHTAPTLTFSGIDISADTGTSNADFNTATAAQTITATLSGAPGAGDVVYGSVDNGGSWVDITSKVSGTTLTWTGATLVAGGGIRLRVDDEHGNQGSVATQAYTLDTSAPTQTVASQALSADSGASAGDFVTNTAAQTISGTLSAPTAAGDFVEVSLNNGSTWTTASNTTGTNTWSLAGQTLAASGTLQVRVTDTAGNHGSASSQAYVVDTTAPTAAVVAVDQIAPSGSAFTFKVTYADTGGSTLDTSTFGTGNVGVFDPNGNKLAVTGIAASGNEVTYTVQAPGGSWDTGDVGTYTVALNASSVRDRAGNAVAADASADTFNVAFSTAPAVSGLALSSDTGISNTDFITNVASQTVTATLSKALDVGDKVWGSLDNGGKWVDITNQVSGTSVKWVGVTLSGTDTIAIKATDSNAQDGIAASHAYELDTTAPTLTVADAALSADNGDSGTDFITNVAAQNIGGTLSGPLAAGEFVEVSLDNGVHWTTAMGSIGSGVWSLQNQTLTGSGTLQARVSDTAGNHGTALPQAYLIDTAAPVAATPVRTNLIDPSTATFTFTVAYSDTGGSGLNKASISTDNVSVTGPGGTLTVSAAQASGNTVTYTVEAPGGSWDASEAGDYTIGLSGGVMDMAGNAVVADAAAHTFHVGFRPTATIAVGDTTLTAGETTTVTITFTQAVQDLDIGDLTAPNGTLTQLATADGGLTWTATLTPAASAWVTSNTIALNLTQVHSGDGTAGTGTATSNTYAVQTGTAPGPEQPTGTVDGVPVTSTQQTDPGTGLVNNTVTVPVVTTTRTDDPNTPHPGLADIPLAATKGGTGAALTVSLPVGTGLDVSGPATLLTNQEALLDLIRRIEQKTASGSDVQQQMTGEGTTFLDNLLASTLLQTATVTPTATAGAAGSILISGATTTGTPAGAAVHGIVLDAHQVGPNVTLQLDNVAFAAVVGAATLRGGAGNNIVIGDDASQSIFLGPEDDQLLGGGGDDVIGSAGGNDTLSGGDGNDAAAGGIGNDSVGGGAGNDILQGGRSDRGHWDFTLAADGTLSAGHQTQMFAPLLSETLARTELDASADALAFISAGAASLRDIALLYHGAFDRAADLTGLNFYLERGASMAAIAQGFVNSAEWKASALNAATDSAYVQALYQQVLGRAGEAAGVAFWLGKLAGTDGPALSRADVLLAFATSAEHRGHYANGIVVAAADVTAERGWITGSGDDRLEGGTGDDVLVGGDGTDTAVFAGKQADYGLLVTGPDRVVLASVAAGGPDVLSGIERGEFADGTLDLSFTQGDQIETLGLLYQAVLDRAADLPGIASWANQHLTTAQLAAGFAASAEFHGRYDGMSDTAFVQALYANSGLDAAAAGGAQSWVSYLGSHTRAELIGTWVTQQAVADAQFTDPGY
ncbi:uncharacterized protein DUF4214 [Pseudoduganella flava]|uniref:DUF4347 domain-containing protein n=1 Tax=Pseudoduganella flava TaxID=871742 RepID=A0A562PTF7_9BURK|nr:DUF4347 domain-containing protein [Pseudoduganella flava]QGZ39003.1 DUF4347 domain-containing protein [Pseudoduganella flava]TWI47732.1 uncharacterized protein DUF4214 [Pseudoduganella flava]